MIIQNDSNSLFILTKVANVFLPLLSLRHGGIAAFGYQKANPAKFAHNIEISSNNCPRRERVAWKYAEHIPMTTSKNQIMCIPGPKDLAYGRCRYTRRGGTIKN